MTRLPDGRCRQPARQGALLGAAAERSPTGGDGDGGLMRSTRRGVQCLRWATAPTAFGLLLALACSGDGPRGLSLHERR